MARPTSRNGLATRRWTRVAGHRRCGVALAAGAALAAGRCAVELERRIVSKRIRAAGRPGRRKFFSLRCRVRREHPRRRGAALRDR